MHSTPSALTPIVNGEVHHAAGERASTLPRRRLKPPLRPPSPRRPRSTQHAAALNTLLERRALTTYPVGMLVAERPPRPPVRRQQPPSNLRAPPMPVVEQQRGQQQ